MAHATPSVAEVFRRYGATYRAAAGLALSLAHRRVMTAIEHCRTAALGGHVDQCDACGHRRVWYNSCRNRHCPSCQALARAAWVEARQAELLACPYFHVVFTVPRVIAVIAAQNKAVVYNLLFRVTAETLQAIAADPRHLGATIGFVAVLHTWAQTLVHHPHLHCVVPGGGLSPDGRRWIACRPRFFLPVRVLSRLFRRRFLETLQAAFDAQQLHFTGPLAALADPRAFAEHLAPARHTAWVVYAKPPFAGPQQVVEYVGRYTHRIAIANHRLVDIAHGQVAFRYRQHHADGPDTPATLTLDASEFIRRFLLHVLPTGFHRIRYYGFLGPRHRTAALARCRHLLTPAAPVAPPPARTAPPDYRDRYAALTGRSLRACPVCQAGTMIVVEDVPRRHLAPAILDTS